MESKITTLVEKTKEGDTDAFSILYLFFYPKMRGICIKILKEDKDVVDDLVQDAFILALTSIKNLKNSKKFSQWLIREIFRRHMQLVGIKGNLTLRSWLARL